MLDKSHSRLYFQTLLLLKDTLPAPSGLASRMPRDICGFNLAGLWEHNLGRQLLWKSFRGIQCTRPQIYIAPSFSWASRRSKALWLSDHNPNSRHSFDHWDAIKITDATCFPHPDSRNLWARWLRDFFECSPALPERAFREFNSPTTTRPMIAAFWFVTMKSSTSQSTPQMNTNTSQFNAVLHPLVSIRSLRKNLCAKPDFEAIRREPWGASQNRHCWVPFESLIWWEKRRNTDDYLKR